MEQDIHIRYASKEDAAALGEIHALAWQKAYYGIVPDEVLSRVTPKNRQQYFEKALEEGREANAVMYCGAQPAGFICLGKSRDDDADAACGEVWGIYLHPDCWHKGLGTQLMRWGLDELKRSGFTEATLWVLDENFAACRFYEKLGFMRDGIDKEIKIGKALKECRYRIPL